MMPRPLLSRTFGITYRKIPILAIGRAFYCDTALIIEALESHFPSPHYGTVYPPALGNEAWNYRALARGFAAFWTDKPLFRTTTGLIPHTVWESQFGVDRAQLIGHALDPAKLRAKVPANLAAFDRHLAMLEPLFPAPEDAAGAERGPWAFPTPTPSLADLALYYQIRWGVDIAAGKGVYNLTGGGTSDTSIDVTAPVWNAHRYPRLWQWFQAFETYISSLPDPETVVPADDHAWIQRIVASPLAPLEQGLVPSAAAPLDGLDAQRGLVPGVRVSVRPDDTGRGDPTVGRLVALGVEEVVIEPVGTAEVGVRIHFPRLGFVVGVEEDQGVGKARL